MRYGDELVLKVWPDEDLVEPRPNRYVWFDGRLTHGVLDAENQLPGRRLPREPRLRLTVAINFWPKRPRGVPRFDERRLYPPLARLGRTGA